MCNLLVFVWSPWDLGATAKGVPPWRYWVQHEDSASYEGESKINLVYACFRDGGSWQSIDWYFAVWIETGFL